MANHHSLAEEDPRDHDSVQTSEKSETLVQNDDNKEALEMITPGDANAPTPAAPPMKDGGTRAWLQVAGSFLVFGNLWGLSFAFGSFQSYYELTYLPSIPASTISWIGTVTIFLLILIGVISGPLFDLGYFRTMLLTGAAVETLAIFLVSVSRTYWQLMLTQGVLMGLGNGLLYLPGLALVSRSFKKNRAIAMGITTCGAPIGGIIYTLVFEQLISTTSFGWTVRAMGFIMLGTYLLSFPLLLFRVTNLGDLAVGGAPRKLFDRGALTDAPFWAYSFSNFFIFCGYMVPFIFIPSYAQQSLGTSRSFSLYIAMIAQATSIVGRLVAGVSAAKIGGMTPWVICVVSSGTLCLGWIGATSVGSFVAIAALYGAFSGALIPLPPSVFPNVCPDPKVFGARLGMAQAIGSFASLIGPPIAAALAEVSSRGEKAGEEKNYLGLQLFAGLTILSGGCGLFILWGILVKRRGAGATKLI